MSNALATVFFNNKTKQKKRYNASSAWVNLQNILKLTILASLNEFK